MREFVLFSGSSSIEPRCLGFARGSFIKRVMERELVLLSYELRMGVSLRHTTRTDSADIVIGLPIGMGLLFQLARMGVVGLVSILPLVLDLGMLSLSQLIATSVRDLIVIWEARMGMMM
jgi:hypothetical protein